jgi:hypothetical protein
MSDRCEIRAMTRGAMKANSGAALLSLLGGLLLLSTP